MNSKYYLRGIWLNKDQYDELQTLEIFEDINDFWINIKKPKVKNLDNTLDQLLEDETIKRIMEIK